jgi:hypothetical protein
MLSEIDLLHVYGKIYVCLPLMAPKHIQIVLSVIGSKYTA